MINTAKIVLKAVDLSHYYTVRTSNMYHKGDSIVLDGIKYVVIGGDVLPKKQ